MKEESKIISLLANLLLRSDGHKVMLEKLVEGQNKINLALNELLLAQMQIVKDINKNVKFDGNAQ